MTKPSVPFRPGICAPVSLGWSGNSLEVGAAKGHFLRQKIKGTFSLLQEALWEPGKKGNDSEALLQTHCLPVEFKCC